MARLLIIDLSNNNAGPFDFGAMRRAGVFGLWHKVSEGDSFHDPDFNLRAAQARRAGLHVGGYHFARPSVGSAKEQADYFASHLGKVRRLDLRPVLDLEVNDHHLSSSELYRWAREFQARVWRRTRVRGLLYSGSAYIEEQHWSRTLGTGAGLWLANYGPNDGTDHGAEAPRPWRRTAAHQYTSVGRVAGVRGAVDLSHADSAGRVLAHRVLGRR